MNLSRDPAERRSPPPPLEGPDQLVTGVITAAWAVALVILLIARSSLPAGERWWIWTCVSGLVLGLFGLWYTPRLKRGRASSEAARPHQDQPQDQPEQDQSAPRASGSNTVSSTETPGRSTMS